MTTFKGVNIAAAVGAGLLGAAIGLAIALSPAALAGGYECVESATGQAPTGAPGAPVCAPLTDMAGVPMALPGPPPVAPPLVPPPVVPPPLVPPLVPPPLAPPVVPPPLVPPVAGAPIAGAPIAGGAPAAVGAPLTEMGGLAGKGKGDPSRPAAPGAPVPGQPTPAGPVS
ncbi:hypothetical protein [Mycobacterium sp. GA-1285]|uniref:hypothetical protein n=1 Tax=Mycobacterium sp. GA-1285 TaxID=1772282 RepID=UPI0009EA54C1|nr:hypothetical protein [Mycobacterium sp. GA-1285]